MDKEQKALRPFAKFQFPSFVRSFFPRELEEQFNQLTSSSGSIGSDFSLSEDKDHVFVKASLPGMKADDIDISFENGTVWIRAEKKEEEEDKNKIFYRKSQSSYYYCIDLPSQVEEAKEPQATYKDGILNLAFTKTQKAQAKKIAVKKG